MIAIVILCPPPPQCSNDHTAASPTEQVLPYLNFAACIRFSRHMDQRLCPVSTRNASGASVVRALRFSHAQRLRRSRSHKNACSRPAGNITADVRGTLRVDGKLQVPAFGTFFPFNLIAPNAAVLFRSRVAWVTERSHQRDGEFGCE